MALNLPGLAGPPLIFRFNGPSLMFARWAAANSIDVVTALNVPVEFVQIPYAMVNPNKSEWRPPGMDLFVWRAITYPVWGMLFWWIAGRGADALAAARQNRVTPRIHWLEMVVGVLLLAMGVLVMLAFALGGPQHSDSRDLWFLAMAILWGLLGSLSLAGGIMQWRLRRQRTESARE